MTDAPLQLAQSDFKIPAPRQNQTAQPGSAGAPQPAQNPPPAVPLAKSQSSTLSFDVQLGKPVSTTEITVGVLLFIVLLVPYFFAKMSMTRGLQSRYAAPGVASEAGWLLFSWLAFTTLFLIAGFIAGLWTQLLLLVPATLISLVLLLLFVRKRSAALNTRR
ncbi:hypothetical protein MKI84_02985 [Ancylobacter sp. A5.8]|uniref:hypothetical protein n=1 Tax=Ancylobacter gelatini TaxID=2919920 RepID=UPI001F4E77A9|nr:hypothetical protein [Ancylobacter gelatini]MCJ8141870.1 hypothetical protein [Ancylobacter gelatini]